MRWYLNPFAVRRIIRDTHSVASNGGPSRIRLKGIGRPRGWILPGVTLDLEVVGRDGKVTEIHPEIPVPWPAAWGYRVADWLGVPIVSDVDPTKISTEIGIPGR